MEWISDEADLDSTSAHTYVTMEGFIGTFGWLEEVDSNAVFFCGTVSV